MMTLNHAEIRGLQLLAIPPCVEMVIVIDVRNPNGFDVAIRALRGSITLADKYVVPVEYLAADDGVWLAADATTSVRIPVAIPVPTALQIAQDALVKSDIAFTFRGKADVSATRSLGIRQDDYAIEETGLVTRAQLVAILPNSLLAPR
jgi:Late embryogenesis abundant protein